jgi:plasmid stabilization system protein ParE
MIRFTSQAIREIDEILEYIAQDNPRASKEVGTAIQRTFQWIARQPRMSPIVHAGYIRSKLVLRYQYRVFYAIEGSDIVIRNVRSTRRLRPWEVQSR